MSDVNFVIGGSPAPFMSAMDRVKESAKESAAKVSESFGVEGLKGERALHTRFLGAFTDITKGGTNSAEAIGGAFQNLAEGLRLSLGSMIALLAVSELVKSLYAGYVAAGKMADGVRDALSINTDVTNQSVEQVQESIKKLKADADANNLGSMSSLEAGATVFVQALEEGKTIAEVTREDAENYNKLKQEAHDMEDREGAKAIDNANAVLELKVEGHDKEAEALAHEQEMQAKLLDATAKGNQDTIDALKTEISLEGQLAGKEEARRQQERDKNIDSVRTEIADEQTKRSGSDADKLKMAHDKTEHDKQAFAMADLSGADYLEVEKARLQWEKSITAEKELQKTISQKMYEEFARGNERDAELKKKQEEAAKKALELAEQKARLLTEQKEAQQAVGAAGVDASLFHGDASSLAKTALGGRVSGANYGNQSQLKAAQDAAKHLADIKASLARLSGAIGVAN